MRRVLAFLALSSGLVLAQATAPQYALRADGAYADPEGVWRLAVNGSKIPINRSYGDMTVAERTMVNASYPGMPSGDEPPFPKGGLETVLRPLLKAQQLVPGQGPLELVVSVDAEGKAQAVRIEGTPGPKIATFAGKLMLVTEFKPAVCSGTPCAGEYKFRIKFNRE